MNLCGKVMVSMVSADCRVSPLIDSVCIRFSWVMGRVKDKILKRESTGDQYVGQCDAGIDNLENKLYVSPPRFYISHFGEDVI